MTLGDHATGDSLYAVLTGEEVGAAPDPRPSPGTGITHAVETVDNDRAQLLLSLGVVR